jgi:DNA polymerase-4
MKCATVQVSIKDTAFKHIQRQKGVAMPTFIATEIAQTAMEIIEASWKIGKPIRMLTVTAHNLTPAEQTGVQLTLFDDFERHQKSEQLERTIDTIRGKYGNGSVRRGVGNEELGIR